MSLSTVVCQLILSLPHPQREIDNGGERFCNDIPHSFLLLLSARLDPVRNPFVRSLPHARLELGHDLVHGALRERPVAEFADPVFRVGGGGFRDRVEFLVLSTVGGWVGGTRDGGWGVVEFRLAGLTLSGIVRGLRNRLYYMLANMDLNEYVWLNVDNCDGSKILGRGACVCRRIRGQG